MNFGGIFILSSAVLVFEMALIRVFSVVLSPGLSFFGISVAMFGITMGGMIAFRYREYLENSKPSVYLALFSLVFASSVIFFAAVFFNVDPRALGLISPLFLFSLASVPFIVANICLSAIFFLGASSAGKWYAADLAGAGTGVVLSVALMNFISTPDVMFFSAILSVVAAGVFYGIKKLPSYFMVFGGIAVILAMIFMGGSAFSVKYSKYGPERGVIFEKWNSFSRITVAQENSPRSLISLPTIEKSDSGKWKQYGIAIDSDAYTAVMGFDGDFKKINLLRNDLSAAAFSLKPKGDALIIGVGGGRDVLMALMHGMKVRGIDINPIIVNDVMRGMLKNFNGGLYLRPDVNVSVAEGRSFIQRDTGVYDAISLPLVDTWASTVNGNLSLVESYLYTSDAFKDYLSHLKEGGILTVSRWSFDGDRLVSLFEKAAGETGMSSTKDNIIKLTRTDPVTGKPWLNNYLFKRSAFTQEERRAVSQFAKAGGFMILGESNEQFEPSTDDKPFFFFRTSLDDILYGGFSGMKDGGLGMTFRVALVFSVISLLFPFFLNKEKSKFSFSNALHILYFAFLGIAFMFIEISLIQKFILYLEYPIYSYSLVLAVMLLTAGLGSVISSRFEPKPSLILNLSFIILFMDLAFYFCAGVLIGSTIFLPLVWKIVISSALVSMPALIMGMFLPLGIKRLEGNAGLIPWAWAVNGSASILASVSAVILAIFFGFSVVILLGTAMYIVAAIASFGIHRN